MIKLIVRHQISWGKHNYYPVNDAALKLFELINSTGRRRCFTPKELTLIKEIGFELVIESSPIQSP